MRLLKTMRERSRLTPLKALDIMFVLLGVSGLLLLVTGVDLVFRHLLKLPKDVALYLSVLSVFVILSLWLPRRMATMKPTEGPVEKE